MLNEKMINWLFETNAFRVCPENEPFWYTSGTIGPYYINTHFLYGSESSALEMLKAIDGIKQDMINCPERLSSMLEETYAEQRRIQGRDRQHAGFYKGQHRCRQH